MTLTIWEYEPLTLVDCAVFEDADWLDLSTTLFDLLDGPVEGLELLDYVHYDLVIV